MSTIYRTYNLFAWFIDAVVNGGDSVDSVRMRDLPAKKLALVVAAQAVVVAITIALVIAIILA